MENGPAIPQELLQCNGNIIDQLLERGEALKDAMSRSLIQDENLILGNVVEAGNEARTSINLQKILFDYLLGKEMSPSDENQALDMLISLPRVDTLFEPIDANRNIDNNEQMRVVISPSSQVLSNPITLKLKFCMLELSESSLRQLRRDTKLEFRPPTPTFLLEYMPPRACGQQGQPIRICSQKSTDRGVIFGQEKLHSFDSKKPLIFNIYFRKLIHKASVLLGSAEFDWNELIQAENTICEFNLPVQHSGKKDIIGRLKVKALLGQGSFLSASIFQHHQQGSIVSSGPRKTLTYPSSSKQAKATADVTSQNSVTTREQAQLLQGLIHVNHSRGFSETKVYNLQVVFKAFWVQDDIQSQIKWKARNPVFNLHASMPVLLSPFFLGRCRGNHAILEVWDVATSGDNLIGLAKLPLQTFYLAYQDHVVAKKLLAYKLPVVSVDQWVSVVNPLSGEKAGELLVLLALGSNEQVAYLEDKRGLRGMFPFCSLYQQAIPSNPNVRSDEAESGVQIVHRLRIDIEKIVGFALLENITDDQAKCFVVCSILGETDSSLFNYVSKLSPCTRETKIDSHVVREYTLPSSVPFSSFFEDRLPTGVMFSVFCQFSQPLEKDVIVAKAFLPISQLKNLQQIFENTGSLSILNVGLCLTFIPCPEIPTVSDNVNGHLLLQLSYSAYPENHTSAKLLDSCTTYSMTTSKSQSCQTEDSMAKQSATQTSIQLTDFDAESDPLQDTTNAKEISTQTSLQLIDFVPESEESDQECQFVPSPELELPTTIDELYQHLKYGPQEVPESNNFVLSSDNNRTIELDNSISDEIIPINVNINTERNQVLEERRPPTPPLLFRDPTNESCSRLEGSKFHARVLVERAVNLPVLHDKFNNSQLAPSTYITMQAEQSGMILASPLVIKSCNPVYDWNCDINLPVQLLMPGSQRLILKLCFAISDEIGHNPEQDIIACFTTISLQVLLTGQQQISAWFDLLDYAGNNQGQLKVCVTPLECLEPYSEMRNAVLLHQMHPVEGTSQQQNVSHMYQLPPNPFSDLSTSALEKKLQEQLTEFDVLANELKSKVAAMNIEFYPRVSYERPKLVVQSTSKYNTMQGYEHPELIFPPSDFVNIPPSEFTPTHAVYSTFSRNTKEQEYLTQNLSQMYPPSSSSSCVAPQNTRFPQLPTNPTGTSHLTALTQNPDSSELLTHATQQHTPPDFRQAQNNLFYQSVANTAAKCPTSSDQPTNYDLYKDPTPSCSTDCTFETNQPNFKSSYSTNLVTAGVASNISQNHGSHFSQQLPSAMPINHSIAPIRDNCEYPSNEIPFPIEETHSSKHYSSSNKASVLHEDHQPHLPSNLQLCDSFQSNPINKIPLNPESQYNNQIVSNNISQISLDEEGKNILEEAFRKFPYTIDDPLFNLPNSSDSTQLNESTSSESNDSDVAKLMSNFDLDTLLRIFEHLEDEAQKAGRCSKPDFVCEKKHANVQTQFLLSDIEERETDESEVLTPVPRQAPDGGNPSEKDKNSRASTSTETSKNLNFSADDSSGE